MISHKPADRDTEAAVVVPRIYGFIEAIVEWIEETARHFKYVSRGYGQRKDLVDMAERALFRVKALEQHIDAFEPFFGNRPLKTREHLVKELVNRRQTKTLKALNGLFGQFAGTVEEKLAKAAVHDFAMRMFHGV